MIIKEQIGRLILQAMQGSHTERALASEVLRLQELLTEETARLDWMQEHRSVGEMRVNGKTMDCFHHCVSVGATVTLREAIDVFRGKGPKDKFNSGMGVKL